MFQTKSEEYHRTDKTQKDSVLEVIDDFTRFNPDFRGNDEFFKASTNASLP